MEFARDVRRLASLERTLAQRGYAVSGPWRPGPMASGETSMTGTVTDIRVTADRGQWFVMVRPKGVADGWFDLEVWSVCLGDPITFHADPRSPSTADIGESLAASWRLQPQIDWLSDHLEGMERACASDRAATVACLLSMRNDLGAR